MCIAPSKDLLHLNYNMSSCPHRVLDTDTLLASNPGFMQSTRSLEVTHFHWKSEHSPRWCSFLHLTKYLSSSKELHIQLSSYIQNRSQGLYFPYVTVQHAKCQLQKIHNRFEQLAVEDPARSIPQVFLHDSRRVQARTDRENAEDETFKFTDAKNDELDDLGFADVEDD